MKLNDFQFKSNLDAKIYDFFHIQWLVVETMASIEKKMTTNVSVVFENVHFEHAMTIPKKGTYE